MAKATTNVVKLVQPDCCPVRFIVRGKAAPAGSKRAFLHSSTGRVVVTDANRESKSWQALVRFAAVDMMHGQPPIEGPVALRLIFAQPRPKGHFTTKGTLSAEGLRNPFPAKRPDLLKLARGVEDALTGVLYRDDAQIVIEQLEKVYGEYDCVLVELDRPGLA